MSAARRRTADARVGVVILVVLAAALYLAFTKDLPGPGGYRLDAVLASSPPLRPHSPVRIAGVQVGEVRATRRGPGTTTIVELELQDRALPVHEDATLAVRPRLFLEGNFFVDLRPGSPSAAELPGGSTLPVAQTSRSVASDEVLGALTAPTRANFQELVAGFAAALTQGGAEGLRAAARPLAPTAHNLAVAAEALQGRRPDDLSSLITNTSTLARAVARNDASLDALVRGAARVTGALAAEADHLEGTIRELARTGRLAPARLQAVDRIAGALRQLADRSRPTLRRLPASADDVTDVLDELGQLVEPGRLPQLIDELHPLATGLTRLLPQLTPLLSGVEPVAACVRDRVTPVLTAKVDDGALTTGLPVWRELLDAAVGLASASASFDGNGYALRFQSGLGDSVSVGSLPSLQSVFDQGDAPLLGSRPAPDGDAPPFVPDAPCARQPPPDLRAGMRPIMKAGR